MGKAKAQFLPNELNFSLLPTELRIVTQLLTSKSSGKNIKLPEATWSLKLAWISLDMSSPLMSVSGLPCRTIIADLLNIGMLNRTTKNTLAMADRKGNRVLRSSHADPNLGAEMNIWNAPVMGSRYLMKYLSALMLPCSEWWWWSDSIRSLWSSFEVNRTMKVIPAVNSRRATAAIKLELELNQSDF